MSVVAHNLQTQEATPILSALRGIKVRWVAMILLLMAIPVLLAAAWPRPKSTLVQQAVWQQVERTSLDVSFIERGNLESQSNLDILCEVEDVQRDGINGTTIIRIIPNGSSVKEGDLLVELESAPMQEALDQQILETEQALADKIQADANYTNQLTQNKTTEAESELLVRLAELELEMYVDEESGTLKLQVEAIKRSIDDVNNEILAAQANMELRREDQRGVESLFKLGYANRNELRRSELSYLQAEGQYAAKLNRLQTELASLKKMENYERRMELMRLEGKVQTAKRGMEQVMRNNEAKLSQMEAILRAREESLKKEQERLERYKTELAACKIYAPQSGMVAYATSRTTEIREGVPVLYLQKLLSIPKLDTMQVRTSVHESVLDQIQPGLAATIRVDAFPDKVYAGSVKTVAVLPEQNSWLGSDTKVYETIVTIDEKVEQLKPGMTAIAEIHVANLPGALVVPIHAVSQRNKQSYVITRQGEDMLLRKVRLGRANDTHVSIEEGIQEAEWIAANPQEFIDSLLKES